MANFMVTSLKGCGHVNTVKRIISVILCFAIVITSFVGGLAPRAFAADTDKYQTGLAGYLYNLENGINDYLAAIGANDDGEYQWVADVSPATGQFYIYDLLTGKTYDEYLAEVQDAYVTDVQTTLGTTKVGSEGYYYWAEPYTYVAGYYGVSYASYGPAWADIIFSSVAAGYNFYFGFNDLYAPVSGYYWVVYNVDSDVSWPNVSTYNGGWGAINYNTNGTYYTAGTQLTTQASGAWKLVADASPGSAYLRFRAGVYVKPTTFVINDFTTSVGGGAGRLGNVPITFATMDEEENLTPVENTYIVNEGDNEYYDIVNNVTYDMSSYTYDYSTRSYEVTYVDNNSVTQTTNVTYGDEYITVVNGGNTYNYYYIVTDSGSGEEPGDEDTLSWLEKIYDAIVSGFSGLIYSGTVDPSASPTYESKVITEPTCTRKGLTLYTNPATGDTYTEEIPALGHDWQLVDQIPDELDGEGNVVTAGYDLYRCSRCGEEYKDYDGTGPPGSDGGGTISSLVTELFRKLGELGGRFIDWILSLGSKAIDGLDAITNFFNGMVEDAGELGGGFTDLLTAFWALLPSDLVVCIKFALFFGLMAVFVKKVIL